jgi:hypothetical protein
MLAPIIDAARRPLVSEYRPARRRTAPWTIAEIASPYPTIAVVEPNSSVTKTGKIEARIPKKTQVPMKAKTSAILYGGIASASLIVVAGSAELFFTFAPIESPLRKINATNPEHNNKTE